MSGIGTVILVVHTLAALAMIGVILLQRSEGGALGIGGGSGSFLSARSAGNVLTRTTTILVVIFFVTSMALTILGRQAGPKSLQFGTPGANGKVVAPQSAPVSEPKPAEPSSNAPTNPISNLPGFGSAKPAAGAPSSGEVKPPVSLEPASPAPASQTPEPQNPPAGAPAKAP